MNGHCSTCDIEKMCGYQYKPCDCCNYRKFKAIPPALQGHIAEAVRQHKNVFKLHQKEHKNDSSSG